MTDGTDFILGWGMGGLFVSAFAGETALGLVSVALIAIAMVRSRRHD